MKCDIITFTKNTLSGSVNSYSKLDGTFSHALVFNINPFFSFQYTGTLKIRHGFYIFCLKRTMQLSKLEFDLMVAGKWHDVKNYICPIKFGITVRWWDFFQYVKWSGSPERWTHGTSKYLRYIHTGRHRWRGDTRRTVFCMSRAASSIWSKVLQTSTERYSLNNDLKNDLSNSS